MADELQPNGCPRCPATLPSAQSAADLVEGKPGSLGRVAAHMTLRAGLLAPGIFLAGVRDPKKLALASLGGSAGIECFVLGYQLIQKWRAARAAGT
jgi:hypothetical protein